MMDAGMRKAALRGRLVRIDDVASTILARHDYPDAIAELSAEAMALSACLASTMDFNGVFTLQAKGDANVKTLFADVTSEGEMRSYAQVSDDFDRDKPLGMPAPLIALMGTGYLAFTVDQGKQGRYQGIVPIEDPDLNAVAMRYFFSSEQIDAALLIAAKPRDGGGWHAAALMLQRIPDTGGNNDVLPMSSEESDIWHTACTLMATCTRDELLDPDLDSESLLFRLFQELEVSVMPFRPIKDQCRCSPERVDHMIDQLNSEEQQDLADDGIITVTCEFCKKEHIKTV
jgi:molecular chaperone Hsp33